MTNYKFGWMPNGADDEEYRYPNTWAREKTSGPERLVIAPAGRHIDLLYCLSSCVAGPFMLLYVLVLSRIDSEVGRYQGPRELDNSQVQSFLEEYASYLESDGRHNLWLHSPTSRSTLVYDRHNVIYAYGPLDLFVEILKAKGLTEASEVRFPVPHSHHYNAMNDEDEVSILTKFDWSISALRSGDENPD